MISVPFVVYLLKIHCWNFRGETPRIVEIRLRYCAVFANDLILAFSAVSGWGCGQRGRCPSHELVFLLPMSGSFLLVVHNSPATPAADEIRVQKKRIVSDAPVTWLENLGSHPSRE